MPNVNFIQRMVKLKQCNLDTVWHYAEENNFGGKGFFRASQNTCLAVGKAWELFLGSIGHSPWEIGKIDVARWVDELRAAVFVPVVWSWSLGSGWFGSALGSGLLKLCTIKICRLF